MKTLFWIGQCLLYSHYVSIPLKIGSTRQGLVLKNFESLSPPLHQTLIIRKMVTFFTMSQVIISISFSIQYFEYMLVDLSFPCFVKGSQMSHSKSQVYTRRMERLHTGQEHHLCFVDCCISQYKVSRTILQPLLSPSTKLCKLLAIC